MTTTAELPAIAISTPVPTEGRLEHFAYYEVTVTYQHMPLCYRLHDEWEYGIDCRGAHPGGMPGWFGTNMTAESLDLPAETVQALRTIWESLFRPAATQPATIASFPCPHCIELIATEGKNIHLCITRISIGRKRHTSREYVGYFNGLLICSGPTYHEVERDLDRHAYDYFSDTHTPEKAAQFLAEPEPSKTKAPKATPRALIEAHEAIDEIAGWFQSFFNDVTATVPEYAELCGDWGALTYLVGEAQRHQEKARAFLFDYFSDNHMPEATAAIAVAAFEPKAAHGRLLTDIASEISYCGWTIRVRAENRGRFVAHWNPPGVVPSRCVWRDAYRASVWHETADAAISYARTRINRLTEAEPEPPRDDDIEDNFGGFRCDVNWSEAPTTRNPQALIASIILRTTPHITTNDSARRRAQLLTNEADVLAHLLYTLLCKLSPSPTGQQADLYTRVRRLWQRANDRANRRKLAETIAMYIAYGWPAERVPETHPHRDAIVAALRRREIRQDPPSAGRALQRQLEQDYLGTIRNLLRLHPDDRRLLTEAYIAHCTQAGNSRTWSAECLIAAWSESAARIERALAA